MDHQRRHQPDGGRHGVRGVAAVEDLPKEGLKLPSRPVIETGSLVLRLVEKGDLPALFAVNGDEEVVRYSPRESWKTAADGEAWFAKIMEYRSTGATLQFVITLRDGGHPIGTMALFHFDESVRSAEVGYVLARSLWGKGLMKEALAATVAFAFDVLGLKRLEAELDPRNAASAKVLERVGFTHEGHRRRNYCSKGEITDTGLYGMLREDPRPVIPSRRL
ncbi:N-acetyltransferase [bacterium]|nr:MAG: N-acetyltransferase [bacterium]